MAEKDTTQKTLEEYNDIFADIVNVLLFDGTDVVRTDSLTAATTHSQYKLSGSVRSQDRDVAKYWKDGDVEILLLGIENQTDIDSDMPFRVIGYDGAAYRDQISPGHGASRSGAKRSSGKRHPVITLVLYFGWQR